MDVEYTDYKYLEFFIKALNMVNMWPSEKHNLCRIIKEYYIIVIIALTTLPILADFIAQFYEEDLTLSSLNENIIAFSALYGVIYISICFKLRKEDMKNLIEDLHLFEEFCPKTIMQETDKSASFYSKLFIIYGIVGNICYAMTPFLTYYSCNNNKTPHMERYGIPCGLIVRFLLPFKFDSTPLFQMVMLEEAFVCTLGTAIIMMVTMLLCGILMHTTEQLKYLRGKILELSNKEGDVLRSHVKFCVRYHTAIIHMMMLLHITWTGFIIGVLGFEIILLTNYMEAVRFLLHLAGWLLMLFLVCYYGQDLMDESFGIGIAVYESKWYAKPIDVQKDLCLVMLRSQRHLALKAVGVSTMSFPTFLGTLYSAYSYFTLLLKMKS